tara:strand:+ start:7087 stop:7536 length:450 start_codon:yes stop_codon:yes gene_type:complete
MELQSIVIETERTPIKDKNSSFEITSTSKKVSFKKIYKTTISLLIFGILIVILLVYIRVDEELKYAHEIVSDVHELIQEGNKTLNILEIIEPETELLISDFEKLQKDATITRTAVQKAYTVTKIICKSEECIDKDDYNDDYVYVVYGKN